jgi:hypothetical protein
MLQMSVAGLYSLKRLSISWRIADMAVVVLFACYSPWPLYSSPSATLRPVVEFDLVFLLVLACRLLADNPKLRSAVHQVIKEQHHGTGNS